MMNRLDREVQQQVIGALVEGSSIRSVERMTGVHRDTIMRLMVRTGEHCAQIMDTSMRDLRCQRLQVDELWCYVGKKQRHVSRDDDPSTVGDFWTFVAIDPDTKLVPSYLVGKRDAATATAFMCDLASRLTNRVQLSSDKLWAYVDAVEMAFGGNVDYGQIVKSYEAEPIGPGRYSPPKVVSVSREPLMGTPDNRSISTSHIERLNLTTRMSVRRFTRLTNAFRKKLENLKAAVALHFVYYNFVRPHSTLGTTPAVAAVLVDCQWTVGDLVRETH